MTHSKRIGICGGTFDPIHIGHLIIAGEAAEKLSLQKVLFIPTGNPPHKNNDSIAAPEHRYEMVRLAVDGNPLFEASAIEIDRPCRTYTIDTLVQLKEIYGSEAAFYYIIGADIIPELLKWKRFSEVFERCEFIAAFRPGYDKETYMKDIVRLRSGYGAVINPIETTCVGISSTQIRQRLSERRPVRYLVPEKAAEYIYKNGLYGTDTKTAAGAGTAAEVVTNSDAAANSDAFTEADSFVTALKEKLSDTLKKDRYEHSIHVMRYASKLSELYGADRRKAEIAGLLHDCARDMELDEMITLCDRSGVRVDALRRTMPGLLHGPAGAAAAEGAYGIEDNEILDAIYYHTTGRTEMGLLEKIIFIADHLSPEREYDGIGELRETAMKNLDAALIKAMAGTISYVAAKGLPIHTDMVEARNCLLAKCVKNGINDGKNK